MTIFEFIVLALAVGRMTSIITSESGPWDVFRNLRKRLRAGEFQSDNPDFDEFTEAEMEWWLSVDKVPVQGFFSKLISCPLCTSVWVGAIIGWLSLYYMPLAFLLSLPFALSEVSNLLGRIYDVLEKD